MKSEVKKLVDRIPYIRRLKEELKRYRTFYPPGHFYSPVPDIEKIKTIQDRVFAIPGKDIPGIDLREDDQMRLLDQLKTYYGDLPFGEEPRQGKRYHLRNDMYYYSDAIFLYLMIRHFTPGRIIEIGSGYSSAVMLDTNDSLGRSVDITFVEPYPDRLMGLLSDADKANPRLRLIARDIQELDLDQFGSLEANDILFVDSSHIVKTHSDVNYILFNILPTLRTGVLIHFHDIFFPFEYPKEWIFKGRVYNEGYFLRAFLQYNDAFRIAAFNSFLNTYHGDWFEKHMPFCTTGNQSIWIQKVA